MTNKELSESKFFLRECSRIGLKPTPRQASKFRRGMGALYKRSIGMDDVKCHIPKHAILIEEG